MPITISEDDFVPLETFQFQHWDQRVGGPFDHIRPLSADAARRAWQRALMLIGDSSTFEDSARFDLAAEDWDGGDICRWLIGLGPPADCTVLVCYQPTTAITVPWSILCEHWLTFFWIGGCVWPTDEQWIMVHTEDVFAFGRRRQS